MARYRSADPARKDRMREHARKTSRRREREMPEKRREIARKSRKKHAEARSAYKVAYRKKNLERVTATDAAYRLNNKEKVKAARLAWLKANPDKHKECCVRMRKRNRAKISERDRARYRKDITASRLRGLAAVAKRRARKLEAGGSFTKDDVERIIKAQKRKCAACRISLRHGYHMDHIKPLSAGGSNNPRNIQALCPPCNQSKHAKDPIEFMQSLGRLL